MKLLINVVCVFWIVRRGLEWSLNTWFFLLWPIAIAGRVFETTALGYKAIYVWNIRYRYLFYIRRTCVDWTLGDWNNCKIGNKIVWFLRKLPLFLGQQQSGCTILMSHNVFIHKAFRLCYIILGIIRMLWRLKNLWKEHAILIILFENILPALPLFGERKRQIPAVMLLYLNC